MLNKLWNMGKMIVSSAVAVLALAGCFNPSGAGGSTEGKEESTGDKPPCMSPYDFCIEGQGGTPTDCKDKPKELPAGCEQGSTSDSTGSTSGEMSEDPTTINSTGPVCEEGTEGCVCYDNQTCKEGLKCEVTEDGSMCVECVLGTDGCPCAEGDACFDPLQCNEQKVCECKPGSEKCPCYGNETCDDGLKCEVTEEGSLCVECPEGTLNCACYPNNTCERPFYCETFTDEEPICKPIPT